ncbi:hypothetical protein [Hyphomicrobium sp. MC8b]|uniref:hypothetical protein n=1 Tax=Hyphomicrobium sp. MC8b TaxID=300273 RepID=UPI00391D71D2
MSETGVSGVNQSQHLAKLSALYAVAISEGRLATNPFAGIKARFTRDEKKQSKKKRAFSDEELRLFLIASETSATKLRPVQLNAPMAAFSAFRS